MFTHKTYIQQDTKYSLNSIAKTVTLNNINYILTDLVNYTQHNDYNGHYTALAYAGIYWYEYDEKEAY